MQVDEKKKIIIIIIMENHIWNKTYFRVQKPTVTYHKPEIIQNQHH